MARLPNVDESQPDPFGPDAAPGGTPERYNTRYIIANLKKEERRTRLIVVGIIVAVAVAIVVFMVGRPEKKLPMPGAMGEGAAAVAVPSAEGQAAPKH